MPDDSIHYSAMPEQVLKASQASNASIVGDDRYRLLVESIVDYAIYMLDIEGRVSSWNRGAQRFKGYPTRRSSASISRGSTPTTTGPPIFPATR